MEPSMRKEVYRKTRKAVKVYYARVYLHDTRLLLNDSPKIRYKVSVKANAVCK